MADLATLRTQLAEAEAALHRANTTGQITDVWNNGRRIRYAQNDTADLTAYIASLKVEIALLDPTGAEAKSPRRRAVGVRFG
jgi:hypothetical protein